MSNINQQMTAMKLKIMQTQVQSQPIQQKCSKCNQVKPIGATCQKCTTFYCSQQCKNKDMIAHIKICKNNSSNNSNSNKVITNTNNDKIAIKDIKHKYPLSQIGLVNPRNACYMNSCLQCLFYTKQLTEYFITNKYQGDINMKNVLGSEGKLAHAYAQCIQNMWSSKQCYNPIKLKQVIGKINHTFANDLQHDTHQIFNQIVDGLHEDLNRVTTKSTRQYPNNMGELDQKAMYRSWLYYVSRNQSIITDTMTGLFKSMLSCKNCQKQSVSFQSFNCINLPIPSDSQSKYLTFYILYQNFSKPTAKATIQYKSTMQNQLLRQIVGQQNQNKYRLYYLSKNKQIVDCSKSNESIKLNQLFLIQLSPIQQTIVNQFPLTCAFARLKIKDYSLLWYKRPFIIDMKNQTGFSFTCKIIRYLYNGAYKFPYMKTFMGTQGKSYESYQRQMLKQRPFELVLCNTFFRDTTKLYHFRQKQKIAIKDDDQISVVLDTLFKQVDGGKYSGQQYYTITQQQRQQFMINNFQLVIQIKKQADQFYDMQKLYFGIDDQNNSNINMKKSSQNNAFNKKKEQKQISLYKCFDAFTRDQVLNAGNLWYCPWCEENVQASKKLSLYRTPDILVLLLNRFNRDTRQKNSKPVKFPFDLEIDNFVGDKRPMSQLIEYARKKGQYKPTSYDKKLNNEPNQHFQLYAYINHTQMNKGGHYVAYAKTYNSKWYLFNDKLVEEVQTKNMNWENAYMMFYRRKRM